MTQRLSAFPNGLLSLTGSQSFGTAPKELGDIIAPTIELADLYLLSLQEPEVLILAAPVNGINAGIRVPPGEVWRVVAGGVFVLAGAGVTLDWTPVVESQGGLIPIGDTQSQAASTTRLQASKQTPFWVKSGDQVTIYIQALVGVPTVSIALLIDRLRA